MGEVNAVVPRCVIPAAMHIHEAALPAGQRQMTIGPVHQPAGALSFEVQHHARQRVALEQVVIDIERARYRLFGCRIYLQLVMTRPLPRREVGHPENPVVPRVNSSGGSEWRLEHLLSRGNIDKSELLWMILRGTGDNCLLLRRGLVPHLVDQNMNLCQAEMRAEGCAASRQQKLGEYEVKSMFLHGRGPLGDLGRECPWIGFTTSLEKVANLW